MVRFKCFRDGLNIYSCKLNRDAKFHINNYARNTLSILHQLGQSQDHKILSEYPPHNDIFDPRLSSTEIEKLQRAFYRFELYKNLFSKCSHDIYNETHKCIKLPPLTAQEQTNIFLRKLLVFQITEITCIRDYLYRRLRGTLDQLENEAVRTMSLETSAMRGVCPRKLIFALYSQICCALLIAFVRFLHILQLKLLTAVVVIIIKIIIKATLTKKIILISFSSDA